MEELRPGANNDKMNDSFLAISEWTVENHMRLNKKKTKERNWKCRLLLRMIL